MRKQILLFGIVVLLMGAVNVATNIPAEARMQTQPTLNQLIPLPVSVTPTGGTLTLSETTTVYVEAGHDEILAVAQYLADRLRPATGYPFEIVNEPQAGAIALTIGSSDAELGDEGYELQITPDGITLSANQPAGLFHGVQTIRQLLPPAIESTSVQDSPWTIPTGTIRDMPRFGWRGMMLDVARHFFSVDDVKRTIDLLAYYKMDRLHLHLADDQGWRIMINSWPELARIGGSMEVGGGRGGYYTQEEYADIVAYAASRYIIIVPEIDMPGHVNAALASYPELNCDGEAPELYTGTSVGFSSLCIDSDITYTFVDDVVREIAALTPGPYIHIGGDEAQATNPEDYRRFVERVQTIVESHGKQLVGWEEIAQIDLTNTALVQHWNIQPSYAAAAAQQGNSIIMSPANKAYLDMQYDDETPLGLNWAGIISVEDGYSWDPATFVPGVDENRIAGIEAPLWSETLESINDIEYMMFPRLCGYAEMGWSPAEGRSWDEYRIRLGAHGPRLEAMGVNFYDTSEVPWQ
jgi:hexosaminidase